MENGKYIVTKKGFEDLKKEYDNLITVRRSEVAEKLEIARGFGDLSENAEYSAAKDEQAEVEARIIELKDQIEKAQIVDSSSLDLSTVQVGCTVKVYDETFEEEVEYTIVGTSESDPDTGLISCMSPVGKALIGAKVGDKVTIETPNSEIVLKILEIFCK